MTMLGVPRSRNPRSIAPSQSAVNVLSSLLLPSLLIDWTKPRAPLAYLSNEEERDKERRNGGGDGNI